MPIPTVQASHVPPQNALIADLKQDISRLMEQVHRRINSRGRSRSHGSSSQSSSAKCACQVIKVACQMLNGPQAHLNFVRKYRSSHPCRYFRVCPSKWVTSAHTMTVCMCVRACVSLFVCLCVCVCVRERERTGKKLPTLNRKQRPRKFKRKVVNHIYNSHYGACIRLLTKFSGRFRKDWLTELKKVINREMTKLSNTRNLFPSSITEKSTFNWDDVLQRIKSIAPAIYAVFE